jgi:hypothetical protein
MTDGWMDLILTDLFTWWMDGWMTDGWDFLDGRMGFDDGRTGRIWRTDFILRDFWRDGFDGFYLFLILFYFTLFDFTYFTDFILTCRLLFYFLTDGWIFILMDDGILDLILFFAFILFTLLFTLYSLFYSLLLLLNFNFTLILLYFILLLIF